MKIFTRHVFREFAKPFIFLIVIFTGLSMVADFFRDLGIFMARKVSPSTVAQCLVLTNIHKAFQLLPVAALVATLFSMSAMARGGEFTAVKVAGVNLKRALIPFFAAGLALSAAAFAAIFFAVPPLVSRGYEVRRVEILGHPPLEKKTRGGLSVALPPSSRLHAAFIDLDAKYMSDAVLYEYDGDFRLKRQIVARRIEWKGYDWKFINGVDRRFADETPVSEKKFASLAMKAAHLPEEFVIENAYPEELNFQKHLSRVRTLVKLGLPYRREAVDFHYRIASALSNFLVLFIGVYFATTVSARHGKVFGFVSALLMAFLYYGVSALGQSLGENGILPPLAAAWTGNIVFGAAGAALFVKIPT